MAFAPPALRRLALAVAVLDDVDLVPQDGGLVLTGTRDIRVSWPTLSEVVERAVRTAGKPAPSPANAAAIDALAAWLIARRAVTDLGWTRSWSLWAFLLTPRAIRAPPGYANIVPGDALCLGFGYGPEHEAATGAGVLEHAGIDAAAAWQRARAELERLGTLAAERDRRQLRRAIMPFGSADVVTLLGSANLRRELVGPRGRRDDRAHRPAAYPRAGRRRTPAIRRSARRLLPPCPSSSGASPGRCW